MSGYRVVCIATEDPHGHVVSVGTAGARGEADWHWPIHEVLRALSHGESFYTLSPSGGERAELDAIDCPVPGCLVKTLGTDTSGTHDSAVETLAACP